MKAFCSMVVVLALALLAGCSLGAEPIERSFQTLMVEVIKPAVSKAMEEVVTQTATMQGGAEAINPSLVIEGYAHWTGTGMIYKTTVGLQGVAGRIAGFGQGSNPVGWDQGTQPGKAEVEEQPEGP